MIARARETAWLFAQASLFTLVVPGTVVARLSLARTLSGDAIENRELDTQGLVAVGDGICAKHGRD